MDALLLLILAFVLLAIWQFLATKKALATTRIESRCSAQEAVQLVQSAFSGARNALWTGATGPGMINMRRRGKDGGIVMSINVTESPGGGSAVDMWASSYTEYLVVLANFAGSVNSRKKAITRLLDA